MTKTQEEWKPVRWCFIWQLNCHFGTRCNGHLCLELCWQQQTRKPVVCCITKLSSFWNFLQRLHIVSVQLGEFPRRAACPQSHCVTVPKRNERNLEMNLTVILGFTAGNLEGGRLSQPVDVGGGRRYGICLSFLGGHNGGKTAHKRCVKTTRLTLRVEASLVWFCFPKLNDLFPFPLVIKMILCTQRRKLKWLIGISSINLLPVMIH